MLKSNFIKKSLNLDLKLKNKPGHRGGGSGCAGYAVTNPWVPSLWWAESIEDWGNITSLLYLMQRPSKELRGGRQ